MASRIQEAAPVLILLVFFGILFGKLLSSHMVEQKPDGLYSGGSTWGDLAWHLSMISNFAARGWKATQENPIFPGRKLSYPFLPDLLSAWLIRAGFSLQASMIAPSLLGLLAAVAAIYVLARKMIGSRFEAALVPVLFFLNGSIAGCFYFWQDFRSSGRAFWVFMSSLPKNYAYIPERGLRFSNVVTDYVLPQRASIFGLLLGVVVIQFLWRYWQQNDNRRSLFYAGTMLSCLPLIHFHSFLALSLAAGFLFAVQLVTKWRQWREVDASWFAFVVPVIVLALPQVFWILPGDAGGLLRAQIGWMRGSESAWVFWLRNLGLYIPVFVAAFYAANRELKTFYVAFTGLFLIANLLVFQPYDYDNLKLMFWWFLLSCIISGYLLRTLRQKYRIAGMAAGLVLAFSLVATGTISVYREMRLHSRLFSNEDLALATFARTQTSKDAIFLTSDKHNNPIACLAGRRIVMGYRGWLWTHGINYATRERDVLEMFAGGENVLRLLRQYQVGFVLLEGDRTREFAENRGFYVKRFPIVFSSPNYTMFKVSD